MTTFDQTFQDYTVQVSYLPADRKETFSNGLE